ncbi:putative lipoprotein [Legionella busanensis]|uniref:Putative lipoprotein n=1 Tax=Legionella busanensis TaxID=190655 RepID=A0A378JIP7_9GAMM|nr:TIGR03751 family conjugal transfer lipoprotein [Legionella busanensis]STX50927.1 putative lipoprotein [Legionella busanensis]
MVNHKKRYTILVCASALALSACASSIKSTQPLPEGGLTVSELYQKSIEKPIERWNVKQAKLVNYAGYTRTAANEIQSLFKPLDNPHIPIYVFPHVALIGDEQLIKPGYTTSFFLYKQNQFALASEHY